MQLQREADAEQRALEQYQSQLQSYTQSRTAEMGTLASIIESLNRVAAASGTPGVGASYAGNYGDYMGAAAYGNPGYPTMPRPGAIDMTDYLDYLQRYGRG